MQEHKKISHLTHRNSVQKTIRMQLNPVGKTIDYFQPIKSNLTLAIHSY